jgi:hypothetical protein
MDAPQPSGTPVTQPHALPLYQLLYGLFFHPHILLLLQTERWGRALRTLALISVCCGLVLGASRVPRLLESSRDWAQWFSREVQEVSMTDGQLGWQQPQKLPYTTRHRGWRVDFASPEASFSADDLRGPERKGIWFSADRVFTWWLAEKDQVVSVPVLSEQKVWGLFKASSIWPEGFSLKGDEIVAEVRRLTLQTIPITLIQNGIMIFGKTLFYVLLFSILPAIFRRRDTGGGFRQMFTFYLYASIPPLMTATLYDCLRLPYLDWGTAFVFGFIVYILLVSRIMRQVFAPPAE